MSLTKQLNDLLLVALRSGISVLDFYDMTPLEVVQTIEAYNHKHKLGLQEQAYLAYQESQLFSCFIGAMFSKGGKKLPTLYEAYPTLFEDEIKQAEIEQEKNKLLAFVMNHNARKEQ